MGALPMYEKLEEQSLVRIPDVKIKVAKPQIAFANKRFDPAVRAMEEVKAAIVLDSGIAYCTDAAESRARYYTNRVLY